MKLLLLKTLLCAKYDASRKAFSPEHSFGDFRPNEVLFNPCHTERYRNIESFRLEKTFKIIKSPKGLCSLHVLTGFELSVSFGNGSAVQLS